MARDDILKYDYRSIFAQIKVCRDFCGSIQGENTYEDRNHKRICNCWHHAGADLHPCI